MRTVIDLNDINLVVDTGEANMESPGYALLQKGEQPVLGEIAQRQSRLAPARTANRFWREFNLNPVGVSHSQVRHHADLVWHHIKQLNSEFALNDALFLTPSHFDEYQLSLLSGILKSQDIRPAALAKRALVAALACPQANLHVEFQLHQVLLTRLESRGGSHIAEDTRPLSGGGQIELLDILLKTIQKRFIQETRFDPLHHASTEQQLVDTLPDILDHLSRAETTLALVQARDEEHRAEIHRDELSKALDFFWQRLKAALPEDARPVVDASLLAFPGGQWLSEAPLRLTRSQIINTARQLQLPAESDSSSPLYLVQTGSGAREDPDLKDSGVEKTREAASRPAQTVTSKASHLLSQGVALRPNPGWLTVSPQSGRLEVAFDEPTHPLARIRVTAEGLELEVLDDLLLNGEKAVGRCLLAVSDYCCSTDAPGGVTAIRVAGDDS